MRLTGLRETIISASDPATMMDRVLRGRWSWFLRLTELSSDCAPTRSSWSSPRRAGSWRIPSAQSCPSRAVSRGVAIKSGITQRCQYAPSDQRVDVVRAAEMGILSLICVPLSRGTDRVGVLILASNKASAFDATDELSLAGLAHFVSSVIDAAMELDLCITELVGPHSEATEALGQGHLAGSTRKAEDRSTFVANVVCPEAALNSATRERIERTLTGDGFSIVLQPIFSLLTGRVVGCEALSRFEGCPQREPDYWFAEASLGRPWECR